MDLLLHLGCLSFTEPSQRDGGQTKHHFNGQPLVAKRTQAAIGQNGKNAGNGIQTPENTEQGKAFHLIAAKCINKANDKGETYTTIYTANGTDGIVIGQWGGYQVHHCLRTEKRHDANR